MAYNCYLLFFVTINLKPKPTLAQKEICTKKYIIFLKVKTSQSHNLKFNLMAPKPENSLYKLHKYDYSIHFGI